MTIIRSEKFLILKKKVTKATKSMTKVWANVVIEWNPVCRRSTIVTMGPFIYYVSTGKGGAEGVGKCQFLLIFSTKTCLRRVVTKPKQCFTVLPEPNKISQLKFCLLNHTEQNRAHKKHVKKPRA